MKSKGLIIGVTGNLGSGKTTVCAKFKKLGAVVINADLIAHELMKSGTPIFKKIIKTFGPEILKDLEIDRKFLGQIVFKNKTHLKSLNEVVHPALIKYIRREITRLRKLNSIVVIEAALLFETQLDQCMDIVIFVKADRKVALGRAAKRLKISEVQARARMRSQMSEAEKKKFADIIIDNRGSLNQTNQQVEDIWQKALLKTRKI